MAISGVGSTSENDAASESAPSSVNVNSSPKEMSEMFLRLLVTQLQHQDPTKPQDETQFIAELASFASLEQLTSINKAVTSLSTLMGAISAAGGDPTESDPAADSTQQA